MHKTIGASVSNEMSCEIYDNAKLLMQNRTEPVAPPGYLIGGAKRGRVLGGAPENFSWTTPSTLAINATNAPFID